MASVKFLSAATAIAASVSVAAFAGCQPSPSAPPPISPTIDPGGVTPLEPVEPDEPDEPDEPNEPDEPATEGGATITGLVYDDDGNKLDGVTITAKLLSDGAFANGSDTLSVVSNTGVYSLTDCPAGVQLKITAAKNGYASREQTFVAKLGTPEAPVTNQLDFGGSSSTEAAKFPLSARPEVTEFTFDEATKSFTLKFSTAVKQSDVVDHFAIYVAGAAGGKHTLSVPDVTLTHRYDGSKDTGNNGISEVIPDKGKYVYDKAAMDSPTWANDRTVTFKFLQGVQLPSDKEAAKVPQYAVSFKGTIHDINGNYGRSDRWFRLLPAQANRVGASFKLAADTTAPKLVSLTALTKANHDGQQSVIRAQFSEPLALFLNDQDDKPIPRNASGSGYALRSGMLKYAVAAAQPVFNFGVASSAKDGFLPKLQTDGLPGKWYRGDTIEFMPLSEGANSTWTGDKVASVSGSTLTLVNDVSKLMIGDLLQVTGQTTSFRVTALNTASKELTFTGSAPAKNANIGYWRTTTADLIAKGSTTVRLTALDGLQSGDRLKLNLRDGGTQTVTVVSKGSSSVDITPALSGIVASGTTVAFEPAATGFDSGDKVWVGINPIVTDPAGNKLESGGNVTSGLAD